MNQFRNFYLTDFNDDDFVRAKYVHPNRLFVKPINPADVNSGLVQMPDNNLGNQAWLYTVVRVGDEVKSCAPGDIVMVQNAALDPSSARAKYLNIPEEEVYAVWTVAHWTGGSDGKLIVG